MKNRAKMELFVRTQNQSLASRLTADRRFRLITDTPMEYGWETAAYAVFRFLRHHPEVLDPLIREAVRLGLSLKSGSKGIKYVLRADAAALQLPGDEARIVLVVLQGEIAVKELRLETEHRWSETDLENAHRHSSNHKPELEKDRRCGCFFCGTIYSPKEIQDWIIADNPIDYRGTAICPYCSIDSVLGESSGYPITEGFLRAMRKKWFGMTDAYKLVRKGTEVA